MTIVPVTAVSFEEAIERVLGHEGGYVFDPADPGGETQWGISKRSYPHIDIKALTRDQAKDLYFIDFWEPVCVVVTDNALRFQLMDAAVNHGMGNATRFLQRALGVADDGHFGRLSHAAMDMADIADTHLLFMAERGEFMAKLSTFARFGRGWTLRLMQDIRYLAKDN